MPPRLHYIRLTVHSYIKLMIYTQWDQMLIPRVFVSVFIHSHDIGTKDTLKDITNYRRNLEIILECGRLERSVGNVNEESYIKKLICSVNN